MKNQPKKIIYFFILFSVIYSQGIYRLDTCLTEDECYAACEGDDCITDGSVNYCCQHNSTCNVIPKDCEFDCCTPEGLCGTIDECPSVRTYSYSVMFICYAICFGSYCLYYVFKKKDQKQRLKDDYLHQSQDSKKMLVVKKQSKLNLVQHSGIDGYSGVHGESRQGLLFDANALQSDDSSLVKIHAQANNQFLNVESSSSESQNLIMKQSFSRSIEDPSQDIRKIKIEPQKDQVSDIKEEEEKLEFTPQKSEKSLEVELSVKSKKKIEDSVDDEEDDEGKMEEEKEETESQINRKREQQKKNVETPEEEKSEGTESEVDVIDEKERQINEELKSIEKQLSENKSKQDSLSKKLKSDDPFGEEKEGGTESYQDSFQVDYSEISSSDDDEDEEEKDDEDESLQQEINQEVNKGRRKSVEEIEQREGEIDNELERIQKELASLQNSPEKDNQGSEDESEPMDSVAIESYTEEKYTEEFESMSKTETVEQQQESEVQESEVQESDLPLSDDSDEEDESELADEALQKQLERKKSRRLSVEEIEQREDEIDDELAKIQAELNDLGLN